MVIKLLQSRPQILQRKFRKRGKTKKKKQAQVSFAHVFTNRKGEIDQNGHHKNDCSSLQNDPRATYGDSYEN